MRLGQVWQNSWIQYRLFAWYAPIPYLASEAIGPGLAILSIGLLARAAGGEAALRLAVIGNAASLVALNGVYGITRSVDQERTFGSLPYLLLAPANRAEVWLLRCVVHVLDGYLNGLAALAVALLVLHVPFAPGEIPAVTLSLLTCAISSACTGLFLGSLSLVLREWAFFLTNVAYTGLLVLAGVTFPLARLPAVLRPLSAVVPLSHGISALRAALSGRLAVPSLGAEVLVGMGFLLAGWGMAVHMERRARVRGAWDWT